LMPVVANAQLAPNFVTPRNSAEQPLPKVVFLGDYITYKWASAFAANPNWVNEGSPQSSGFDGGVGLTGNFQTDVIDQHPAIVHIMVGAYDGYFVSDQSALFLLQGFLSNLDTMVKEAKAANIKVVLGTTPPITNGGGGTGGYMTAINSAIAGYGAANNIPVIDYADALCGCPSLSTDWFPLLNTNGMMASAATAPLPGQGILPSTTGYALMTQLAESVVDTMNLKLLTGWLSDVELPNETLDGSGINVNTVSTPGVVQFTPIGYYSDGSTHPMLNTNMQYATGTWTSSNPEVMYINQQGLAYALSGGTTVIKYTPPSGAAFSEWVMYVGAQ
jgi:hypothetical protein